MHKKGRVDAQRSKMFGKLAREVTVAAKLGLPDPDMNPRLRAAILAARAENMPKDNIERAIKKAQGGDAESYDEIRYEGYGPGGAALIVEAMTDNRNRTASDIRSVFTKSGGNLAETGAVAFMFDRVGVVAFDAKAADADTMLGAAIEAGADDVVSSADGHEVYCDQGALGERVLVVRDDGAAGHEAEARALDRDEPPAGAAKAGVDAENADRAHTPIFAIAASDTSKFTNTFCTSSWSSSDSTRRMSFSAASSSTSTVFWARQTSADFRGSPKRASSAFVTSPSAPWSQ